MTRWFRFYDESLNDPKILRLSDNLYRAWTILLCFASKNGGVLPSTDDIALALRIKPAKVSQWIEQLVAAELIDLVDDRLEPHNWKGRQYKSDVTDPTAPQRMKRYRSNKRNDRNATVTLIRPDTEQIQTTEQIQSSEANASGAGAPDDPRKRLFNDGLKTIARLTGKGPDACRSFVGKCLKAASDDAVTVLGLIEDADRNQVVDASAWIAARLKTGPPISAKPLTEFQRKQAETNNVTAQLRQLANGGGSGGATHRLLPDDHSERPENLCGGVGSNILALPGASGRRGP